MACRVVFVGQQPVTGGWRRTGGSEGVYVLWESGSVHQDYILYSRWSVFTPNEGLNLANEKSQKLEVSLKVEKYYRENETIIFK